MVNSKLNSSHQVIRAYTRVPHINAACPISEWCLSAHIAANCC